jgi:predicted RNase H-like HicB family nuclease
MEFTICVHVEKLPEGIYLGTSDDVQGLVVQGKTISETLDFARDAARNLLELQRERSEEVRLPAGQENADYTIVVAA